MLITRTATEAGAVRPNITCTPPPAGNAAKPTTAALARPVPAPPAAGTKDGALRQAHEGAMVLLEIGRAQFRHQEGDQQWALVAPEGEWAHPEYGKVRFTRNKLDRMLRNLTPAHGRTDGRSPGWGAFPASGQTS